MGEKAQALMISEYRHTPMKEWFREGIKDAKCFVFYYYNYPKARNNIVIVAII